MPTLSTHLSNLPLELHSGPPWHVSCTIEKVGLDYLCRLHAGARCIGAVALSKWQGGRATTQCLTVATHEEEDIAVHSAHKLCRASRRNVTCIVGIHADSNTNEQLAGVAAVAFELVSEASRRLEGRRLVQSLHSSTSLYSDITSGLEPILGEIDAVMKTPVDRLVEEQSAPGAWAEQFQRKVRLFAPLYLANACPNDCAYCGFRRSARFKRTKLSAEEALADARELARQGHRTIDLVTPEIATDRFVDSVCEIIQRILDSTQIHCINLNMGCLSGEQYGRLRAAGATGYHLYQETYDPDTYFTVHRSGLKRDMAYRLEAPHRALERGFERIGLGILLGLRALREDLARLARHGEILARDFPGAQLGFSLPRIRQVDDSCEYEPTAPITDEPFVKALVYLRRKFPKAHLTVTTRERPELRDRLIPLGVTKVSAGVSTRPGGYAAHHEDETAQFEVSDGRSLAVVADVIERAGLTATYS